MNFEQTFQIWDSKISTGHGFKYFESLGGFSDCHDHAEYLRLLGSAEECPVEGCDWWQAGDKVDVLKKHLWDDHCGLQFCEVCLKNKKSFLQLQTIFESTDTLKIHSELGDDDSSFSGHPSCR